MKKMFDSMNENTMYEFLSKEINEERISELDYARDNYQFGELEELVDDIESTYDFNMTKLDSLADLMVKI